MSAALESVVIGEDQKVAIFATVVPDFATISTHVGECKRGSMALAASGLGNRIDSAGIYACPPGAPGLTIETRLNGQVMQSANTRDMILGVAETVELLSACMTLEPGDVLVMGTPAGVGAARKSPVWMKAGDVVEVSIEGIGALSNPVVAEQEKARAA
jgi:2-keto-4-pentenoate hydratase/2-oxohepta-3-ene-1,7-dioic acid hydratase in catechol pathway